MNLGGIASPKNSYKLEICYRIGGSIPSLYPLVICIEMVIMNGMKEDMTTLVNILCLFDIY